MDVKIACPKCGQHLIIENPTHLSGVECPNCGNGIVFYEISYAISTTPTEKIERPVNRLKGFQHDVFHMTISELMSIMTEVIVSQYNYTIVASNENMISFETGMNLFSWSGMTGTIVIQHVGENQFKLIGSGKQNIRGGQVLTLGGNASACKTTNKVIHSIQEYASEMYNNRLA